MKNRFQKGRIRRRRKILPAKKKKINRSIMGNFWMFLLLTIIGSFMALPMVYAINNAFKPLSEIFIYPPEAVCQEPNIE